MSKSKQIMGLKSLKVKIEDSYVGTLALSHNGMVAFSYDKGWLARGFSISPFSLPLEEKVFVPNKTCFEGLFGVFADSLPDAWGRLLLKRILEEQGNDRDITVLDRLAMIGKITVLDRPAMIGKSGMGALEYEPEYDKLEEQQIVDLDSWKLSPAYDLTYSNTYFGEHTTSVDGNGKNPGEKELLSVGLQGGLKKSMCMDIISEIKQKVKEDLETYLQGGN